MRNFHPLWFCASTAHWIATSRRDGIDHREAI
jgi:hypothetical protein